MNFRHAGVDNRPKRSLMFWRCVGLILVLLGAGLFMVARFGRLWPKPQAQPKTETVVHKRRLPSGTVCRVALVGVISAAGRTEELEALEVSIDGRPTYVPTEAYSDLHGVAVRGGVELAEFARETYVLLTGGTGATAWQTKFTVRDLNLVERQLRRAGADPVVTHYAPPFKIQYFSLPTEEIEKARKLQNPRSQEESPAHS